MKYTIRENTTYEVEAINAQAAMTKFLDANSIERDALFFVSVDDREVTNEQGEVCEVDEVETLPGG